MKTGSNPNRPILEDEEPPRPQGPVHPLPVFFIVTMISLFALGLHHFARMKIAATSDGAATFLKWSTEANRKMVLIDNVHQHPSWGIAYLLIALGLLGTLLVRHSPRWAIWLTMAALFVPVFSYGIACAEIISHLSR